MSTNTEFVELILTCANQAEAESIARELLKQKLVACVKFQPVSSRFIWKDDITSNDEILALMESSAEHFDMIEEVIATLHSYDTFVLKAIPIAEISNKAAKWLAESLQ